MIKKLLLPSIFVMCFQLTALAQTQTSCNNNPNPLLTVGTDCSSPVTMDTANNVKGWSNATGCGASNLDDVWAAFVAVSTSTTITYTPTNGAYNPILHIFLGDTNCGPVTSSTAYLACSNAGGAGVAETIVLTTVIGERYRIRVQDATVNTNYTGTICVYDSTSTGPPNDLCTNATALPCGTSNLVGSTNGASNLAHGTGCSTSNYGVWYSFVGDGNQTTITSTANFDHRMNIARGTCGGLVPVNNPASCVDGAGSGGTETYTFITTNATVYYVYIAHFSSSSTTTGNFTISRTCTPVTSPPNDAICGNTFAPVNADLSCASVVPGTLEFATNQAAIPNTCPSGNPNNDVWYRFTATSTSHRISLLNIAGNQLDLYHAVWSGPCTSPTLVAGSCSDPETSTVTGLTIGNIYFVQVYSWTSAAANTTFNLCIGTQPPCPTPVRSTGPITFGTITNVSINGSFPAATPTPDNYIVIRNNITATPPTLTNGATYTIGQTLPGGYTVVDTDTNTNFTATGLTQTTTYNFFIFSMNNLNCTGGPVYSINSLTGSATTVVPTYCIPSSTDSTKYIDNFSTSGGVTNIAHVNSGYSPGGYGDFTSRSVTQYPGSGITFSAQHVGGTFQTNIWVDWNNDLVFSVAEKVYDSPGYLVTTTGTFNVIPTALAGNYRMRVRSAWINSNVSACGAESQSETHDYTLVVTPLNCTANPLSLVASATSTTTATISWTAPSPAPVNGYEYIVSTDNSTSTPAGDITGFTSATTVNLTGLALGTTYYVFVRGLCTAPDKGVWIPTTFTTGCTSIVTTPTVCPIIVDLQANNPYTASPFIANPAATIGCATPTVTLVAHANLRETTSYIVEQTTYPSPAPLYDFPALGGGQAIASDDVWADARANIGFNFCFYNQTYTQALVGSNGAMTLDPSIAPGSPSGYAFSTDLPSLAGALFEQTIYGVYHDLNPFGLTGTPIKSRVVGVAGCRQFQVAWNNIPMFGDSTRLFTGMIVLHESTNIIEVFIKEKRIENGNVNPWNGGNAIVGIQGDITPLAPNNQYSVAPCRNALDTNWETTNEAWRFTPNGAVIAPSSVTWYQGSVAPANIVPSNPDNSYTAVIGNTYIAQAVYNNLCGVSTTFTDQIVVTDGRKTWNGSVSNNWATAANWTPAVIPTPLDCVTIPVTGNNPVINGTTNGDGFTLSIFAGATLTMQPNATLTIVDQVTVAATANFTLQSSASLIQVNNVANIGNITMLRDTNIRMRDYVYWGTPVNNFPLANVIPASPAGLRLQWNPSIDRGPGPGSFQLDYGVWETASGNMATGKGYIIRGPNGFDPVTPAIFTASFTGNPNNGNYTTPIRRGTYAAMATYIDQGSPVTKDDDNWNLVSNPYPSALNASAFLTLNTDIDGTVYLWTHGTRIQQGAGSPFYGNYSYNYNISDYLEYNLSGPAVQSGFFGNIGAGQGFFVLMNECPTPTGNLCPVLTSSVTFNNSMRSNTFRNDQFFRSTDDDPPLRERIWLDLVSPSGGTSSTLIAYVQGATDEKDRLYDARTIGGSGKDLYSVLNDENYIIQGRQHPLDVNDQVPMGITTEEIGIFNIAIHGVDGLFETTEQGIYLEDRELNVIHDLRNAPYTFTLSSPGNYDDRFILRYNTQTLGINDNTVGLFDIIAFDNQVKVTSGVSPIQTVVVYDMLGRVLADYKDVNLLNFDFYLVNQSKGALIVKATLSNGQQKIKKVIY